ncbi:M20/M25/M40 family metallo-hydrolase [Brumimicrobium aurantiacum]|uniref:M20/M25/M40 family metallo-hydrolase n=1 Tax=Brumimicrobium aurantiacum TaxID=1737063 RepID=A0A3E1EZ63_9FLAO|nr:M20/M25/M40 family metallo-hydrolase [Brumimicrobium aurantiacum]RFC54852.1 M20/M25/M40 family metallo-hydrolase [Brumimicrobium aurantiacum]
MAHFKPELLEKLIEVRGTSGDEGAIKDFILNYVNENKANWKSEVEVHHGEGFQDAIVLIFGKPRTAIFAHTDTIGFTVGYNNNLIKIGGPRTIDGMKLVGSDSQGEIETELMVIEDDEGNTTLKYVFDREIDRGTNLSFKPDFNLTDQHVQTPYLDNRLGVLNALTVCEDLENGAVVFSTYEEHGGGSVGFLGRFLYDNYKVRQALISDITWVTDGVQHDGGVAISMRDKAIPRRSFLNKIIALAKENKIKYQLEVESAGGSDGSMLQMTDLPFDWCFIGAPEDNVHSPTEKVYISDIEAMIELYKVLMKEI